MTATAQPLDAPGPIPSQRVLITAELLALAVGATLLLVVFRLWAPTQLFPWAAVSAEIAALTTAAAFLYSRGTRPRIAAFGLVAALASLAGALLLPAGAGFPLLAASWVTSIVAATTVFGSFTTVLRAPRLTAAALGAILRSPATLTSLAAAVAGPLATGLLLHLPAEVTTALVLPSIAAVLGWRAGSIATVTNCPRVRRATRWQISVAAALIIGLGITGAIIHTAQTATAASTRTVQTRGWAATESRLESAAAAYGAIRAADRATLLEAIDTAAAAVDAANYVSAPDLEGQLAASRDLYALGDSASLVALGTAAMALAATAAITATAETNQEMAAAAAAAAATAAQAALAQAAARNPALAPPAHITPAPAASPAPVANLRDRAQAILDRLGGGVKAAIAPGAITSGAYGSCHAQTALGQPLITIESCPAELPDRQLYDLVAHEWVHSQTFPGATFPVDDLVPGIPAPETIADCYAMAKLGTDPAPGGYMKTCTPAQTADSFAAVGRH